MIFDVIVISFCGVEERFRVYRVFFVIYDDVEKFVVELC